MSEERTDTDEQAPSGEGIASGGTPVGEEPVWLRWLAPAILLVLFLVACAVHLRAEGNSVEAWVKCVAALSTLAIVSVLYRENRLYRLFEHLFIGTATGYGVFVAWRDNLEGPWWTPLTQEGRWYLIFPLLVASLWYTVYSRKYAWMSRLLIGTLFGLYAGMAFQNFAAQMFPQVSASFLPLWPHGDLTWSTILNNWVFVLTLLSVMTYFFFSFRHSKPGIRQTAVAGRWLLMIAFGAAFGSTVMARFSLFIARLKFLLLDWLQWGGG